MLPEIESERKTKRKHKNVAKRARLLVSQSLRRVRFFPSLSLCRSPADSTLVPSPYPHPHQTAGARVVGARLRSRPLGSRTGRAARQWRARDRLAVLLSVTSVTRTEEHAHSVPATDDPTTCYIQSRLFSRALISTLTYSTFFSIAITIHFQFEKNLFSLKFRMFCYFSC